MILPEHLAPLPVSPHGDDAAGTVMLEDFVTAVDVRKVLLGTAGELPVEGLAADDFDSFAGRADVAHLSSRSPFAAGSAKGLLVPDLAVEPLAIHPAFEVLPPKIRRAAPPRVAPPVDCEAGFGRSRKGDRWWVIGMGFAAAAILLSGTLVDFVSREAVRRSRAAAPLDVIHVIPGEKAAVTPGNDQAGAAFAAKLEREAVE